MAEVWKDFREERHLVPFKYSPKLVCQSQREFDAFSVESHFNDRTCVQILFLIACLLVMTFEM